MTLFKKTFCLLVIEYLVKEHEADIDSITQWIVISVTESEAS